MDVTCKNCGARLMIPDSKLPPSHMLMLTLTCPKCKHKITVDGRASAGGPAVQKRAEETPPKGAALPDKVHVKQEGKPVPQQKKVAKPEKGLSSPKKSETTPQKVQPPGGTAEIDPEKALALHKIREIERAAFDYEEDISPLEFFEEGTKLALILEGDDARKKEIKSVVEGLSYKPFLPASSREAMGKLLFHHFDLIVLSDGFDGLAFDDSPIAHYLNHVSMSIRRKVFLVLLSNTLRTMDNMQAFGRSADLVVNPDDLSNFSLILKKATADHEKFYRVFMDTLREAGKG